MSGTVSGPMFEKSNDLFRAQRCLYCRREKEGAHYNHYIITGGIHSLKCLFPEGEANEMNFVLFSTSGVHGSYQTIENIEAEIAADEAGPYSLTVLIVQPRICCLRYAEINIAAEDIPYLKQLRASSWLAVQRIGKDEAK
jgi:hypothetical protein